MHTDEFRAYMEQSAPDLSSNVFFLWGHLKSKAYANQPIFLEDIMQPISPDYQNLFPEILC